MQIWQRSWSEPLGGEKCVEEDEEATILGECSPGGTDQGGPAAAPLVAAEVRSDKPLY